MTDLADLTHDQIDHLLHEHVHRRDIAQAIVLTELEHIDQCTARIERLLEARCQARP